MESRKRTRAVVSIPFSGGERICDHIKRLALFFDEVVCIPPNAAIIKNDVLNDRTRTKIIPGQKVRIANFNYFRDTHRGLIVPFESISHKELRDTLLLLEDEGVVRIQSPSDQRQDVENQSSIDLIRNSLIAVDFADEEFSRLSGTSSKDLQVIHMREFRGTFGNSSEQTSVFALADPPSIEDSYILTSVLYWSYKSSAYPVFLNPEHRAELAYRYMQYKDGILRLQDYAPSLGVPMDITASFGEIVFSVANSIFSAELISQKTTKDIIKYRNAMTEAREKFLSRDLIAIADIVQENPWNDRARTEIRNYIEGKLHADLVEYDGKSREVWERLFGSLTVHLTEITRSALMAGTVGGMLGSIIPNTTTWEMVLLAALAGISKETPKLVRTIVDQVLETRAKKRNAIAYLADFHR